MAGGHKDAVFAQGETVSAFTGGSPDSARMRERKDKPRCQRTRDLRSCPGWRAKGARPFVATVNSTGVSQERLHPTGRVSGEAQSAVVATVNSTGVSPLIQRPTGLAPSGTQSADLIRLY